MKTYWMRFGSGDPRTFTGLSPTLIYFFDSTGATLVAPAITEGLAGSGMYKFSWGTTNPVAFIADAATTSPGPQGRYISGTLDPADRADEYGATIIAGNASLTVTVAGIGTTTSSFGTSVADPVDLFGYMKRILENLEGNNTFVKSSGALTIYSRGSSYTLAVKTVTNSVTTVIKT